MTKLVEDEVVLPHRKSRKGVKKPYTIEWRLKPDVYEAEVAQGIVWFVIGPEWRVWQKYPTPTARDEALKNLQKKAADLNGVWHHRYEYRVGAEG